VGGPEAVLRDTALRIVAVPALPPLMSRHERKAPPETVAELVIGSARGVLGQDVPELGHEAQ
jgi:hypothetical protein